MNVKFKFDMSGLQRAIKDLRPQVQKSKAELVEQAAKGFVKNVVAITPPASKGVSGSKAKQQGEQAIKSDLARIMVAAARKRDRDTRSATASPEELHRRFRDRRTGRINPGGLKSPYRVPKSDLLALQRRLLKEVGWLLMVILFFHHLHYPRGRAPRSTFQFRVLDKSGFLSFKR